LLELGIIVESESSFASPIVLVPRKDQSTRMCIDFRKLNKMSKFDAYPMPTVLPGRSVNISWNSVSRSTTSCFCLPVNNSSM
jgi:hypothetical protein